MDSLQTSVRIAYVPSEHCSSPRPIKPFHGETRNKEQSEHKLRESPAFPVPNKHHDVQDPSTLNPQQNSSPRAPKGRAHKLPEDIRRAIRPEAKLVAGTQQNASQWVQTSAGEEAERRFGCDWS